MFGDRGSVTQRSGCPFKGIGDIFLPENSHGINGSGTDNEVKRQSGVYLKGGLLGDSFINGSDVLSCWRC